MSIPIDNGDVLFINSLIQWNNGDKPRTERIIWDDDDNYVACIDVYDPKAFPAMRTVKEIQLAIKNGDLRKLKEQLKNNYDVRNLSDKAKQQWEKRVHVAAFIKENSTELLFPDSRGKVVKEAINQFNIDKVTFYKIFRRYLQRGMNDYTLLPDFNKCGGKGEDKIAGKDVKLGRPPKYLPEQKGVNVTPKLKESIDNAFNKFFVKQGKNLEETFDYFLDEEYAQVSNENGIMVRILPPAGEMITRGQFRYHCMKDVDKRKIIIARIGSKKYNRKLRSRTGTSQERAYGVGTRYEMDAQITSVYLVSRITREAIGTAIVYTLIDVFSRMVTGLYVGFEGPSWLGAMTAILYTLLPKEEYLDRYGIKGWWPCQGAPEKILSDRGEMESTKPAHISSALGIDIELTASFRGDLKGIVEGFHAERELFLLKNLPGYIRSDWRERGVEDYRKQAKLDIDEFTELMILQALQHNSMLLTKYRRDAKMIQSKVKPIPDEIYVWANANGYNRLHDVDEDIAKLNLMPTAEATVTDQGILFRELNLFYLAEEANQKQWFERYHDDFRIEIVFNPRCMDEVYIRKDDGTDSITCHLAPYQKAFFDRTYEEIKAYRHGEKEEQKGYETYRRGKRINFQHQVDEVVDRAAAKTDLIHPDGLEIKDVKKKRQEERDSRRHEEAALFKLGKDSGPDAVEKSSSETKPDRSDKYPNKLELLAKKQKENFHD